MKRVLILLLFVLVAGCGDVGTPSSKHFKSLDYKFDVNKYGVSHELYLYSISGEYDLDALRELCRSIKKLSIAFSTHVVVFDSASNARWPKFFNGMSGYSTDDDISAAKHIKAIYKYVESSGHSELELFPTNSYESVPKRETIR